MRLALIGLALCAYAGAYFVWTLGHALGAVVVALFGYLVLRSRAKLAYEMAWRRFRDRPDVASLLAEVDADTLAQGEAAMRRQVGEREGDVEQ